MKFLNLIIVVSSIFLIHIFSGVMEAFLRQNLGSQILLLSEESDLSFHRIQSLAVSLWDYKRIHQVSFVQNTSISWRNS